MFIKLPVRQELGTYCVFNMVLGIMRLKLPDRSPKAQSPVQDNKRFIGTCLGPRRAEGNLQKQTTTKNKLCNIIKQSTEEIKSKGKWGAEKYVIPGSSIVNKLYKNGQVISC